MYPGCGVVVDDYGLGLKLNKLWFVSDIEHEWTIEWG